MIKEIDLPIESMNERINKSFGDIVSVPFKGDRADVWGNTGSIKLYMLISRLIVDHAIYYMFIDGDNDVDGVREMIKVNAEAFGTALVLIDTGEAFYNVQGAELRAKSIKDNFKNANVLFPPVVLQKQEIEQGETQ